MLETMEQYRRDREKTRIRLLVEIEAITPVLTLINARTVDTMSIPDKITLMRAHRLIERHEAFTRQVEREEALETKIRAKMREVITSLEAAVAQAESETPPSDAPPIRPVGRLEEAIG